MLNRRRVGWFALPLLLTALSAWAQTEAWPSKPIRLVVTFPPGGSSDAAARIVAPRLAEKLGQPVVIDNRPGAGGGVGLELVAKAPADGYTIVLASAGGLTANPSLYKKLSYDPARDFAPITTFGTSPFVLLASTQLAASNVNDLLKLVRSQPGRLSYASGGNGTAMHLSGELLKSMAKVHIVHIPYRGVAPAFTDLIGGQTQAMFPGLAAAMPHIRSGRVRPLAVTGVSRHPLLKDTPTLVELGYAGFDAQQWYGVVGPANMPAAIVKLLNESLETVLKAPDLREKLSSEALEPISMSPEKFAQFMRADIERWTKLAQDRKIDLDA